MVPLTLKVEGSHDIQLIMLIIVEIQTQAFVNEEIAETKEPSLQILHKHCQVECCQINPTTNRVLTLHSNQML